MLVSLIGYAFLKVNILYFRTLCLIYDECAKFRHKANMVGEKLPSNVSILRVYKLILQKTTFATNIKMISVFNSTEKTKKQRFNTQQKMSPIL